MHPHRLLVAALVAIALLSSACSRTGASAAATPTPSKTPVIIAAATATNWPPPATPTPDVPTATPTPSNLAPFTGLPVADPTLLTQHPVFICINNDAAGRAQHYGVSQADGIYEYIVDGFALTRLTAMYQSQNPNRVGPVRSARLPNIKFLYSFDGILACSGASDAVRYLLKNEVGFPYVDSDIDDPNANLYFQSIGNDYRTRMQASPAGVRRWIQDKLAACQKNPDLQYCTTVLNNWTDGTWLEKPWNRPGFPFSDTPPAGSALASTTASIAYPGGNNVQWKYDPAAGGYLRFQAGQQQFDLATGQPIVASNVVIAAATHTLTNIIEDVNGTLGVDIELFEYGDLRVLRDGQVYEGTWRADDKAPPRWLGAGDAPIPLKPGQTWVQVVQKITDATFQ